MNKLAAGSAATLVLFALAIGCDDDDDDDFRRDAGDAGADVRPPDAPTGDVRPPDAMPDAPATPDGPAMDAADAAADAIGEAGADGAVALPDAGPGEAVFVANLTGAEEVPPVATTAVGSMSIVLNAARNQISYTLQHNVMNATAAHLHLAPGGVNGPVAIPIDPLSPMVMGTAAVTAEQVMAMEAGRIYANVHSMAYPAGEIRGQVLRPGETLYTAVLSGAAEVPPVTTMATGGLGFILNPERTMLRYEGEVTGLVPTAAHIHTGAVGVNGGIVYPLVYMGTTLSGTQAVTAADLAALDAAGYYANVHTAANPAGEIRGQIIKR